MGSIESISVNDTPGCDMGNSLAPTTLRCGQTRPTRCPIRGAGRCRTRAESALVRALRRQGKWQGGAAAGTFRTDGRQVVVF